MTTNLPEKILWPRLQDWRRERAAKDILVAPLVALLPTGVRARFFPAKPSRQTSGLQPGSLSIFKPKGPVCGWRNFSAARAPKPQTY